MKEAEMLSAYALDAAGSKDLLCHVVFHPEVVGRFKGLLIVCFKRIFENVLPGSDLAPNSKI